MNGAGFCRIRLKRKDRQICNRRRDSTRHAGSDAKIRPIEDVSGGLLATIRTFEIYVDYWRTRTRPTIVFDFVFRDTRSRLEPMERLARN
jgi:hypothetical protein